MIALFCYRYSPCTTRHALSCSIARFPTVRSFEAVSVESFTFATNNSSGLFEFAMLLVRKGWVSLGNANRSGISSKWWNCYPEGIRFRFLCFDGREVVYSESVVFSADACLYRKREKLHGINVVYVDSVFIWAGNERFANLQSLMYQRTIRTRCFI